MVPIYTITWGLWGASEGECGPGVEEGSNPKLSYFYWPRKPNPSKTAM
jgi:hypothetical protein